jgi:HlyD family secretion protein
VKLNRIAWIGLILVIGIVGGYLFLTLCSPFGNTNQSRQAVENELQSAVARMGDLTLSVSGSGELVAISETSPSFEERGELVALNVGVGDQVQAGDVLASLKIDQTEAELVADKAKAELEVLLAQQNLEGTYETAQLAAAQALVTLEESQLAVDKLQNYELEQALALETLRQAEEAVQDAETSLYIVNSTPSQAAMDTAYASLLFKEKELNEIQEQIAQAEYQFKSAPNQMVRDRLDQQLKNLRVRLANQQLEYENALYKYETLDDPPEEVDLSVAETRLATTLELLAEAQRYWEKVQEGPPAGDLAMAEAQLAEAQSEWERSKDGPDPDELELMEAQLAKAELELLMLQDEVLVLDLVAPMDGIVLSIDAEIGDRINNKPILTLADLSKSMVAVSLDEIDMANIQVGNQAEVRLDALPDQTLHGQVVQIDPSLVRIGNLQAARIWVLLDALPSDLIWLPLGINTGVDIVTGEAVDAILVTIEALYEDEHGGYVVYVISGESLEPRTVQVGLMDATTAEIMAGLQPGEQVAIGNLNFDQE